MDAHPTRKPPLVYWILFYCCSLFYVCVVGETYPSFPLFFPATSVNSSVDCVWFGLRFTFDEPIAARTTRCRCCLCICFIQSAIVNTTLTSFRQRAGTALQMCVCVLVCVSEKGVQASDQPPKQKWPGAVCGAAKGQPKVNRAA